MNFPAETEKKSTETWDIFYALFKYMDLEDALTFMETPGLTKEMMRSKLQEVKEQAEKRTPRFLKKRWETGELITQERTK